MLCLCGKCASIRSQFTWTFIAAPTTSPTLCATKDTNRHAARNIPYLQYSKGWDVMKYTTVTYKIQKIVWKVNKLISYSATWFPLYLEGQIRYRYCQVIWPQRVPPVEILLEQHRHLEGEWKYRDRHRCVHEEQHVEEQEPEVAQNLVSVIAYIVVERSDEQSDKDVGEESEVHQSLQVGKLVTWVPFCCFHGCYPISPTEEERSLEHDEELVEFWISVTWLVDGRRRFQKFWLNVITSLISNWCAICNVIVVLLSVPFLYF